MEKYGFVYIWYDSWRKMYYIGSHWGTTDDKYICSSNRMRDAYRRRPEDFKRRILSKIFTDRQQLLQEEHRWLSMIDFIELGKKYYNLNQHHFGHWSTNTETRNAIGQKISKSLKGKPSPRKGVAISDVTKQKLRDYNNHPEIKDKMRMMHLGRKMSEETKQKLRLTNTGKKLSEETKNKIKDWNKSNPYKHSDEIKRKIGESKIGRKLSEEQIESMRMSRTGIKTGKQFQWKIQGPDNMVYLETGLDVFCRTYDLCANNLRVRGKSKGFTILEKIKL